MTPVSTLIRGGRVIDGTGSPWIYADVLLEGDRVTDVLPPDRFPLEQAAEIIEAEGKVVCPGFIDIQSHSIVPLMVDGRCLSKITQGVTTEIMGEARTPAPFGGRIESPLPHSPMEEDIAPWRERATQWTRFTHWLDAMVEAGVSPNVGSFLGGGTLRAYAKGMDVDASDEADLRVMRRVAEEAMLDGAFGVSYALIYAPDTFATTPELIDICRTVAKHSGVYITHLRSETSRLLQAIDEAVEIGRAANLPVEIYHLKAAGSDNWNLMPQAIARIEQARLDGVDVTADMYPYTGSGTGLSSVLPPWVSAAGERFQNLLDPNIRKRVREEVMNPSGDWEAMAGEGPQTVMPIGFEKPENLEYAGKRLSEIAEERGQDWLETVVDLLASEGQRIFTVYFSMSEGNVTTQLRLPWIKISTDAGGVDPAWAAQYGPTHPRAYGTYPRVLGKYVRDEGVLTLEDAVHKMSGAVAHRLRLPDRGMLRRGFYADVVIFDPRTIGDRSTFDDSHQLSEGVSDVWVNGERVLKAGEHTGAKPGRVIRNSTV